MRSAFFLSTAKQAAALPDPLFSFDFEQNGKFSLINTNQVVSYTDRGYTFNIAGSFGNAATLEADGLQLGGGGTSIDLGKKLVYAGNIPFNYAFMVVKEGRLGTSSSSYNNVIFSTSDQAVVTPTVGLLMATNNSMTLRSQYRVASVNQSHRVNQGNVTQTATIVQVSFGTSGAFKILRVKLNTLNAGNAVSLGAFYSGDAGYSHSRFKRCDLYNCTDAQADIIWANLRAYYSL